MPDDALLDLLLAQLRPAPRRLLVVGFGAAGAVEAGAVERVTRPEEAAGEGFDAAVVDGRQIHPDAAAEALGRIHRRLADRGQLLVAVPVASSFGDLAPATEERWRRLVAALSVLGTAWRRDRELAAEGAARWRLLAGRKDAYAIRSYRPGDEEAIVALFHRSFHPGRSLAGWRWKYRENPWGGPLISLAHAPGGSLACHYAGYPLPFLLDGRRLLAMHMGDTMSAAEHRDVGRGRSSLLARTVRHFFARHRDGRFAFYFGFNTGPIQRFCEWFIGGSAYGGVCYRARDLDVAGAPPYAADRRYRAAPLERAGAACDRLLRRAGRAYGFLLARDAAYLDWRYLRPPDERYVVLAAYRLRRLVGWGVFRRQGDVLTWGDALFHPRHAAASANLLAAALDHPELRGARRLEAWFPSHPPFWHRRLEQLGLEIRPEPQDLGLVYLADHPAAAAALSQRRLYYAKGDGDLF
ncbi:MAG: GNAT family N-acetyltransferase [Acidobacteria bacterium]|nr:MAG: GNAT family N-acetyltransferase [Acidobacteriota bacterium]